MGVAYGQDLRDRVLAAYDCGMATKQIANLFQVSKAWARRVKQRRREAGETTPRPRGGATIIKIDCARLAALVRKSPDATLLELRAALGVDCTEAAICLALKRLGFTFKKRQSMRSSKRGRTSRGAAQSGSASSRASTASD
ncbi:MAG: IS630 transposase-related protein [Phycisphaerae bacterium]